MRNKRLPSRPRMDGDEYILRGVDTFPLWRIYVSSRVLRGTTRIGDAVSGMDNRATDVGVGLAGPAALTATTLSGRTVLTLIGVAIVLYVGQEVFVPLAPMTFCGWWPLPTAMSN